MLTRENSDSDAYDHRAPGKPGGRLRLLSPSPLLPPRTEHGGGPDAESGESKPYPEPTGVI
jgi:hypothetical protein